MNHYFFIHVKYSIKISNRSWLFRLFVVVTTLVISCLMIRDLIMPSKSFFLSGINYLPSEMPYFLFRYFNLFQCLAVIFLTIEIYQGEKKFDSQKMRGVYPLSNIEYDLGYFVSVVVVLSMACLVASGVTVVLHLCVSSAPFQFGLYVFYWMVWCLPTLIFMYGLSFFTVRLVKHVGISLMLLIGVMCFDLAVLSSVEHGSFDFFAHELTAQYSDVNGYPNIKLFLLQRLSYLFGGIGFVGFAMTLNSRQPNNVRVVRLVKMLAFVFVVAGITSNWVLQQSFDRVARKMERYKQSYVQYASCRRAVVKEHDIRLRQKEDMIRVESRMLLKNEYADVLERVVLYLNPCLRVKQITSGGDTLSFKRDNQVVIVQKSLSPGEYVEINVDYEGGIDQNVCYIDVLGEEYQSVSEQWYRNKFQATYFAFMDKRFTLLTPECLWYPVSVPPVPSKEDYFVGMNFTHYTLTVYPTDSRTIISQGEMIPRKDCVTFKDSVALPGVCLVIGDYGKKSIRVKGVDFEIYYFEGHDYFSEYFPSLEPECVEKAIERYFPFFFETYSYHKFTLVETPAYFHSWNRERRNGSECVQPEMIFLAERGYPLNLDFKSYKPQAEEQLEMPSGINDRVLSRLVNVFSASDCYDIEQMLHGQTMYVSSDTIPVIDVVVKTLLAPRDDQSFTLKKAWTNGSKAKMLQCLATRSLKDCLSDSTLSDSLRYDMIKEKVDAVRDYILTYIPRATLDSFMRVFWEEHRFEETTLSEFSGEMYRRYDIPMSSYLPAWYNDHGLPRYHVKDAALLKMEEHEGQGFKVIRFKILNSGNQDGAIKLIFSEDALFSNGAMTYCFNIPAGEAREIRVKAEGNITNYHVETGVSQNIPGVYYFDFRNQLPQTCNGVTFGIFSISPADFHSPENEIVVDNEDPGFQLTVPRTREKLIYAIKSWFKPSQASGYDVSSDDLWRKAYGSDCYGDVTKSFYHKLATQDNARSKATWKTRVPTAGYYTLYFYNKMHHYQPYEQNWLEDSKPIKFSMRNGIPSGMRFSTSKPGSKAYYTIKSKASTEKVEVDMNSVPSGWVELGIFYFPEGEACVELEDRGGVKDQIICADAVKWVRKIGVSKPGN